MTLKNSFSTSSSDAGAALAKAPFYDELLWQRLQAEARKPAEEFDLAEALGLMKRLQTPGTRNEQMFKLLFNAVWCGHAALAEEVVKVCAELDDAGFLALSALDCAAYKGDLRMAKLLLDAGIPVSGAKSRGTAPLISAAEEGHEDVVRLLLARGADPCIKNSDGDTPAACARKRKFLPLADLLAHAESIRVETAGDMRLKENLPPAPKLVLKRKAKPR